MDRCRIFSWLRLNLVQWILVSAVVVHVAAAFGSKSANVRQQHRLWAVDSKKPFFAGSNDAKLTPAQRALQQTISEKDNDVNALDKVKKSLYVGIDSLQSLAVGKNSDAESKVIGGYSEIEKEALQKKNPLARTLSLLPTSPKPATATTTTTPPPKGGSEPSPTFRVFDSFKGAVYGTVDKAEQLTKKEEKSNQPTDQPVVHDVKYSKRMREMFPDLQSENYFKRAAAEVQYQLYQQQERARKANLARQEALNELKQKAYQVGDTIQETAEAIQALPETVEKGVKSAVDTVQSIADTAKKTVEEIQTIPDKVQQTVIDVQDTVKTSIANAKQFVEDVKALPEKARQTVEDTKQGFESAVDTVQEVATNTKVLLGLEKPKPRPPKTKPPTPPTPAETLLNAAGTVAFGTGKFALWAGKSLAGTAFNAIKESAAASKTVKKAEPSKVAKKAEPSKVANKTEPSKVGVKVAEPSKPSSPNAAASTATTAAAPIQKEKAPPPKPRPAKVTIETELDLQVQEALRIAEDALSIAEGRKKEG